MDASRILSRLKTKGVTSVASSETANFLIRLDDNGTVDSSMLPATLDITGVSGNFTVGGNFSVTGTTTLSETSEIKDNIIILNSNVTSGSPTEDAGIQVRRGGSTNASIKWNESLYRWELGLLGGELPVQPLASTLTELATWTDGGAGTGDVSFSQNAVRRAYHVWDAVNDSSAVSVADGELTFSNINYVGLDSTGKAAFHTALELSQFQPIDGDLTALAALSGTNTIYYRAGTNTWSPVTIGTGLGFSGGTLSNTQTSAAWGNITGTLSNQTDLNTALGLKSPLAGSTSLTTLGTVTAGTWNGNIIAPAYGGFGQDMTMQTVSTTGVINALPCGLIRMTGSSAASINGIAAPSSSALWLIHNDGTSTVQFVNENASASAANRIKTASGGTLVVPSQAFAIGFYDTTSQRHHVALLGNISSVSTPLTLNSGNLGMVAASGVQSGYLLSGDFNTFFNKVGKLNTPDIGDIAVWTSTTNVTGEPNFNFDTTFKRLGVQVYADDTEAALHVAQTIPQTVSNLSTAFEANLVQVQFPPSVTDLVVDYYQPLLQRAVVSPNLASGALGAGTYYYRVWAGYDYGDSTKVFAALPSDEVSETSSGSDNIELTMSEPIGLPGELTPNIWIVERGTLAGVYDRYVETTSNPFVDDDSPWTIGEFNSGDVSLAPDLTEPEYTRTFNIAAYSIVGSTTLYSPSDTATYTSDNSGHPYRIEHNVELSSTGTYKIVCDEDNNAYLGTANNTDTFLQGSATFDQSGLDLSPTTYGIQSNGSALTANFDFYGTETINGVTVYQQGPLSASTTDPNDGNYYYILFTFTDPNAGKIINTSNSTAQTVSGGLAVFDNNSTWGNNLSVNPAAYYAPAAILTNDEDNVSPNLILRSGGAGARLAFQANSTIKSKIELETAEPLDSLNIDKVSRIKFEPIDPANVGNNQLFLSSATNKLSFKNAIGVVNVLY